MFYFLLHVAAASESHRLFVPQAPAVQPATAVQLQPFVLPVDTVQPVMHAMPVSAQQTTGSGLFYGVGVMVVSLAVGGAVGSGAAKKLMGADLLRLRQSRQQLIEADESNGPVELRMLSEKLALDAAAQSAFYTQAGQSNVVSASGLMEANPVLERRQMLIEQDEANSVLELQLLSEKLRLEDTRQAMFDFDAQLHAVQDTVTDAVSQALTSGEEYARKLPGALPILGYFDPLGILSGSTEEKVQYYRDAELKHGRIGTLAAIGILASEAYHPFGGDELNGVPAVFAFEHNLAMQTAIIACAAALASRPQKVPNTERKQTTEIWHVRGGMLAAFGMIADEAVTKTCLICT